MTPDAGLTASVYDQGVSGKVGTYHPGILGASEIRFGSSDVSEEEGSDDELRHAEQY